MHENLRAERLFHDVETTVEEGGYIHFSRHDSLNRIKRYLLRNRRNVGLQTVSLVVVGVLGGPIGLGVAAAGKALGFGAKRVFRYGRVQYYRHHIKDWYEVHGQLLEQKQGELVPDREVTWAEASAEFGNVLKGVRYVCSHGILTDLFNVFSELERDYDALLAYAGDPPTVSFKTCSDAVKLWEGLSRVHYRFESIRNVFHLFDDLVLYTVLEISRMNEEYEHALPLVWSQFTSAVTDPAERYAILNAAANSGDVLHTRFRMFGRSKDYSAWIKGVLHSKYHGDVTWPGAGTDSSEAVAEVLSEIGGEYVVSNTVGSADSLATHTDNLVQFGLGTSQESAASSAGGTWVGGGHSPVLQVDVFQGAGLVQGGAEIIIGVGLNRLNARLNQREYETGQHGIFWHRDAKSREKVGLLRTLAKENLEKFITKFQHWQVSHREFMELQGGTASPQTLAAKLLRRNKHQMQVNELAKFVFEFSHVVVRGANEMSGYVEKNAKNVYRPKIHDWICEHDPEVFCHGVCYNGTGNLVRHMAAKNGGMSAGEVEMMYARDLADADELPAFPAKGPSLGELVLDLFETSDLSET